MRSGHDLRRAGRYAEAAEAFANAEGFMPGNYDALLYRATCLKQAGNKDEALQAYQSLVKTHPERPTGWRLFGVFLKNEGEYEEAIQCLTRSLQLEDDFETRNTLVVSLFRAGRHDEAQREGSRNLELKDKVATRRFRSSPFSKAQLNPVRQSFDPRTPRKNIISFSLWGDNPVYVHGAIVNARIAPHIYYGWTTRFYCDSSVPLDAVEELRRAGAQIVPVTDPALQAIRPLWRFMVSDDPEVDWFVCRDTDSRLNCQELLAVEEWLRSGLPFHVMRDHIQHMELMLAGMWGGAAGVLPNLRQRLLGAPEYANNRFADQAFLMNEVWPLIRDQVMTHDGYYRFHGGRDFPEAYRLPQPVHVGGAVKQMPHWRCSPDGA
jgi:hypothetical protein